MPTRKDKLPDKIDSVWATTYNISDLNSRELQLIRLLAEGLTNQEIADRTGLTLNTVKWYFKQIYAKLYVKNRTQAVAKAREFNLLDDAATLPRRGQLPARLTPIVGRQHELAELAQLFKRESARLVTIYGIGGMGKTALALELARQVVDDFADGVFFVPLAQSAGQLYQDIARNLYSEGDHTLNDVAAYFYKKRALLILDNFESFLYHAAELSILLQRTNNLCLLVTSRERLNLQGEFVFSLQGLATTTAPNEPDSAAYRLFAQCVRATTGSFNPNDNERASINAICQLLGGMPLAIEMAAKWFPILPVQETYHQLSHNLDLLTTDERDRPKR